jgi:SAM-dependent methyltransferase
VSRKGEAPASDEHERLRVERAYQRYRSSARKRRSWDAQNPGNVAIRAELVDAVAALARDRLCSAHAILDVGCGTGWWLARLAADPEIAATLHGIDMLPDRVASAQRRVPAASLATGDARALPYEDRSLDVVTLFTVLSSLSCDQDVQRALSEARRVLAASGKLLVWEPRLANPLNPSTLRIGGRLLEDGLAGFHVERRTTTLFPPLARRLGSRAGQLYPALARLGPLRTHLLICATMSG